MKKLLLAAFAAITTSASAATLTWGFGSGELFLAEPGGEAMIASEYTGKLPDSTACLVLVYLGTSETIDYSNVTVVDSIEYASAGDYYSKKQKNTSITAGTVDGCAANDWFAILWYDGKKYSGAYNLSEWPDNDVGPVALGSMITATVQVTSLDSDKQFQQTISNASSETAGILVVPEPSVALLGLLGIGTVANQFSCCLISHSIEQLVLSFSKEHLSCLVGLVIVAA